MTGPSAGRSRQQPSLGRRPLRRCQSRVQEDNVVLIDVESGNCENVVIIDVPELLSTKFGGGSERLRRGKKAASSWKGVICLDDDEDIDHDFGGVGGGGNFSNGASSGSKSNCSSSGDFGRSSASERDGGQFVQENVSPVKLSKGKRTYSGKAPTRNHFGLADMDDLSCKDILDCEVIEDSYGVVKEMWEKAYSKRKWDLRNGEPAQGDSNKDPYNAHKNVSISTDCRHCKEPPSVTKQPEHEAAESSFCKKKGNLDYTSDDSLNAALDGGEEVLLDSMLKKHFSYGKDGSHCSKGSSFNFAECCRDQFSEPNFANTPKEQGPSSFPCHEKETRQVKHVNKPSQENSKIPLREPCLSRSESCAKENVSVRNVNLSEKEPPTFLCKQYMNSEVGHGRSSSADQNRSFPEKICSPCLPSDPRCNDNGSETKLASQPASHSNTISSCQCTTSVFTLYGNEDGPVPGETCFDKGSVCDDEMSIGKDYCQVNMEQLNERSAIFQTDSNEVHSANNHIEQDDETNDSMHSQDGEAVQNHEFLVIGDREKLKETDEYKKALEEEWASRQRTLQIQSEEAQNLRRLRKRMKTETMRLLDMEKRQKQRLEEIRESQKKDQENCNLKEIIRAEVRKELNKLEVTCCDMASLLRGLGIPVGGGLYPPLLSEVRLAYKRALLAFHPDRASRSDIRQQVEAEEKFKLISRKKEKFLPS